MRRSNSTLRRAISSCRGDIPRLLPSLSWARSLPRRDLLPPFRKPDHLCASIRGVLDLDGKESRPGRQKNWGLNTRIVFCTLNNTFAEFRASTTVPKKGEINRRFGVYKSSCCSSEIIIREGATFPGCPKHPELDTIW